MAPKANPAWPVLTKYDQDHLARIALPLGGIGTGTISLGGRGDLRDWEVVNRPAKGFNPRNAFFALWAKPAGGPAVTKALEGAIEPIFYEGAMGCPLPNHNLPRFRNCSFQSCYPLGQVLLSDPDVPVDVRLEGFNPLVPADNDASGVPAAVLRFVLTNKTGKTVDASVCGSLENFLGTDGGSSGKTGRNTNAFRTDGLSGIFMTTDIPSQAEQYGTFALTTTATSGVTFRTTWRNMGWGVPLLDFWDDFSADGKLDNCGPDGEPATGTSTTNAAVPTASLAASVKLAPHASKTLTFLLTWHFPNRITWTPRGGGDSQNVATDIHRALTPCARTYHVSEILAAPIRLEGLACPDLSTLKLERRAFANDFGDRHLEFGTTTTERVAYYVTRFECPQKMSLAALVGYDGPVRVWVDGKEIFHDPTGTNPARADAGRGVFEAAPGKHELVVALGTNGGKAWGIYLRLERTDLDAQTIAKGRSAFALPELTMEPKKECGSGCCCGDDSDSDLIGNYYTTQYRDAWDAAVRTAKDLKRLEGRTLDFLTAFCDSDVPAKVKEAALYTLTGLRSQTTFRTPDGRMYGWEGCGDRGGCCYGSCTHVWNYEHATGFLFGALATTMREVEFMHATADNGLMSFRVNLPLGRAQESGKAAADGQMGAIMRLYREWQLSGDEALLRQAWPNARKALAFCWTPGGWDADQDGVMEGCQHNTMDVEYYGPNGQMGIWYLGALRACEEMARHMDDGEFASKCRRLFENGSAWIDANLFNGEFYEQQILPPKNDDDVAAGLRIRMAGGTSVDWQLGAACLVDQLVGQYTAHVVGLGYLVKPENVRKTLAAIKKYNFKKSLVNHFNHLRTFVLNGESATLMATYPLGRRPKVPFPYCNEVMTGFEYTAAIGMLQEGMAREGLELIEAVRGRYTGNNRSPYDEAECGHHYARAMATWAAYVTVTGFAYSGVSKAITFAATPGKTFFWANGYAWGTCRQVKAKGGVEVELAVMHGSLTLKELSLRGVGAVSFKGPKTIAAGKTAKVVVVKKS